MRWCVVVCMVGCGRVGFDAATDARDPIADALILPSGPWGPAVQIASITAPGSEEPTVTADGLELVFRGEGALSDPDLFVTTRSSMADPWGTPRALAELNTTARERTPCISPDGLTLWFASDRPGTLGYGDIFVTTRAARTDPWQPPTIVYEVSTTEDEVKPMVSADGLEMFFEMLTTTPTDREIHHSTRASRTDPWSAPEAYPTLDSPLSDSAPQLVTPHVIAMASNRFGGSWDVFWVRRTSEAEVFDSTALEPMSELNSSSTEWDVWGYDAGHRVVFGSSRDGGLLLYEASR